MALRIFKRFRELLDVDWSSFADGDVPTYNASSGKLEGQPASAGGGAPTDVDYLVGTASGDLSAEIVVGTSPGGELGGTWASPTVDATHSGSSHASVQAAAEATAAAALSSHAAETTGVHGIADTSALLDSGDVGSTVQGFDSDLSAIAALAPTNDDVVQRKAGAWTNRTMAQLIADLAALGTTFQPLDTDLTTIAGLADPNADRILFWDDSAGGFAYLTAGTGLSISGTTITASGGSDIGTEEAYNEITSNFTTTTQAEATAATVVTASSFTADGTSAYLIEFYAARWFVNATNGRCAVILHDGSSSLGLIYDGVQTTASNQVGGLYAAKRIIPSAGSKTYSIRAYTGGTSATLTISAGSGGAGAFLPAFVRITKVT